MGIDDAIFPSLTLQHEFLGADGRRQHMPVGWGRVRPLPVLGERAVGKGEARAAFSHRECGSRQQAVVAAHGADGRESCQLQTLWSALDTAS